MSVQANQVRLKPADGLATVDNYIDQRATLTGVAANAADMGTGFTNIAGANNQSLRNVLLAIDSAIVTATTVIDNLTSTSTTGALSANQGKVLKDRQDVLTTGVMGVTTAAANLGAMTPNIYTDNSNVKTLLGQAGGAIDAIQTLTGVSNAATHLGTIGGTGTVVSNNSTIKLAVEQLDQEITDSQALIGLGGGQQFGVGAFTGSTIGDAGGDPRTVASALQDLETFVEGIVTGITAAGGWDATTADPTGAQANNSIYRVTVPGTTSITTVDGVISSWAVGDQILKDNGGNIYKIDNTDSPDIAALRTLTGTSSLDTNLGAFSAPASGILTSSTYSIKAALQALGNSVAANAHTVVNTLTSTSTTDGLSAAQGKVLKDKQDLIDSRIGNSGANGTMGTYSGPGNGILTVDESAKGNLQRLADYMATNTTGIRVNRLVNTADIAGSTTINIDGTTANTTLTAEGTAVGTLGASAGAFNTDPEIQVYINGLVAEKGVDVVWVSATSFNIPIDWYTGGHITIVETNKNLP